MTFFLCGKSSAACSFHACIRSAKTVLRIGESCEEPYAVETLGGVRVLPVHFVRSLERRLEHGEPSMVYPDDLCQRPTSWTHVLSVASLCSYVVEV